MVVVHKFIAERIISYRNENENSGILLANRDFHLQSGSLRLQMGFSGYYLPGSFLWKISA